ncbi:MAG: hypothetical protein U5R06_10055 [candidate division KSB1 bacterium]|nr:hypothetical protein [candidate division KSB1 bacterium]
MNCICRWAAMITLLLFGVPQPVPAVWFTGQISSYNSLQKAAEGRRTFEFGSRYLPELTHDIHKDAGLCLDTKVSANMFWFYSQTGQEANAKLYRCWFRFATPKFESRIGLQKINFGPARLLRSLMWFDQLDPRDPLKLTDGVYGLRLRYDFENLSSIWLWGLLGNGETKGLEFTATRKGTPEYGGRLQIPLGPGEIGVTTHRRITNPETTAGYRLSGSRVPETRIALDGIWDVGLGLWFESALMYADYRYHLLDWQSFITLGSDYTFPFANGVHVLAEHMLYTVGNRSFDRKQRFHLSGVMLSCPVTWLDQVSLYSIYNWESQMAYHYLSWQRSLDRWLFHAGFFKRSGTASFFLNQTGLPPGRHGLRLMLVFHY